MDIPQLMAYVLSFAAIGALGLVVARLLRLELTLACLLSGLLAGIVIDSTTLDIGLRASHVKDLVFYLFLPVLVFDAAWHLRPAYLRRWFMPAMVYANLGALIAIAVATVMMFLLMGSPQGFPWQAALLTAVILTATDPVSVVSKLEHSRAPEDLRTLFESESVLNDALAAVLFTAVLLYAAAGHGSAGGPTGHYVATFAWLFIGGALCGVVFALLASGLLRWLDEPSSAVIVLLLLVFGTFYVAERTLHSSGIIAVAVAALTVHWRFEVNRSATVQALFQAMSAALQWQSRLFTLMIFVLMGLVITLDMFTERWLAMLFAIFAAVVARFVGVYACSGALSLVGRAPERGWSLLLGWGGLRGVVAVALALSLPVSLPYWWTVQSMVFGVVLFTLLVQGGSFAPLLRRVLHNRH